jgi:YidC/Oxa1 family membrane protein insertase
MKPSAEGAPFVNTLPAPSWFAFRSTYFAVAFKPGFEDAQGWVTGLPHNFRFGVAAPRFEVAPEATHSNAFKIYLGPTEQRSLAQGWETLPKALRFYSPTWDFMDKFSKALLWVLNIFHDYVPNYGLAIIFLTILVRMGMLPLMLKSMKSMKKMQMLGPEMQELKTKYADDSQELNKKMMELYKERGVNPLGGCLPMLLQMPVFFALYRMLQSAYELRGAHFFWWISDLSQADHMFPMPWTHSVPFLGVTFEYFNLLPILMGLSMLVSQKVMPVSGPAQNQQQKVMMYIMPFMFSFFCYTLMSGLNLYILTSTVLGVVQQQFVRVGDVELKAKKTVGKRQHFYTAAQARKRQMAREAKQAAAQAREKKRK